jgi:hypothetical protein
MSTCLDKFGKNLSAAFRKKGLELSMPMNDFLLNLRNSGYNMEIVEFESKEVKDTILNMVLESNANSSINVCLRNHFFPSFGKIDLLSGSCGIDKLVDSSKTIYLISDCGHSLDVCESEYGIKYPTVVDLIKQILQTSDRFIDLFLEYNPINNPEEFADCHMTRVEKLYHRCFEGKGGFCPPNARIHWADFRVGDTEYTQIEQTMIYEIKYDKVKFLSSLRKIANIYENKEQMYDWTMGLIERNRKLKKEFSNVKPIYRDEIIFSCIVAMHEGNMRKGLPVLVALESMLNRLDEQNGGRFLKDYLSDSANFKKYRYAIISPYAILMDIYLISRIFKTFNIRDVCHPPQAVNVLVYVGSAHAAHYRKVLQNMKFKLAEYSTFVSQNCCNISDLIQPFFS